MQHIHFKTGSISTNPLSQAPAATLCMDSDPTGKKRGKKNLGKEALALLDKSYIWMNKLFKLSA